LQSDRQTQSRLTEADVTRMIAAYRAGTSMNQLAADFGINRNTVSTILDRRNIPRRRRGLQRSEINKAAALYQEGWPLSRIGDRFGCTAETVRQALKRTSVQRRNPWERPTSAS
jgi:lambda repressor-like predicted transcriptional regulator